MPSDRPASSIKFSGVLNLPDAVALGWCISVGLMYVVGGLLTHAVVNRMSVGLQLFFNVNVEVYWLVMAVIGLSYVNSVVASGVGRRSRTILVWGACQNQRNHGPGQPRRNEQRL